MTLTPEQRLAIFEALPTVVAGDGVLVFEDDGGGWHHDPAVQDWVSWAVLDEGRPYVYSVNSILQKSWSSELSKYSDEVGRLDKGVINLYICSTHKAKVQAYASVLAHLIDFHRLNLSLDDDGVTLGPESCTAKPLGSYSDNRLRLRVWRSLIEIPIIYRYSETVITEPIFRIGAQPYIGSPNIIMGDELVARAAMPLAADILLQDIAASSLSASIVLA